MERNGNNQGDGPGRGRIESFQIGFEVHHGEDGRLVRVFFETVEVGIVHCFCYPMIDIESARYRDACVAANEINCHSKLGFVQVFKRDASLVIRTHAPSTGGGTSEDFNNVAYAALLTPLMKIGMCLVFSRLNRASSPVAGG